MGSAAVLYAVITSSIVTSSDSKSKTCTSSLNFTAFSALAKILNKKTMYIVHYPYFFNINGLVLYIRAIPVKKKYLTEAKSHLFF